MGFLIFFPIILPLLAVMAIWEALKILAPLIAVLSLVSAAHSTVVAVLPARIMTRAKRTWVRVLGGLLISVEAIAALAFIGLTIAFTVLAILS